MGHVCEWRERGTGRGGDPTGVRQWDQCVRLVRGIQWSPCRAGTRAHLAAAWLETKLLHRHHQDLLEHQVRKIGTSVAHA
jgi:hypothetical protein